MTATLTPPTTERGILAPPVVRSLRERNRRVLHVLEPTDGGVPEWVRLVAKAQVKRGHTVGVAGLEDLDSTTTHHQLSIGRSNPLTLQRSGRALRELASSYDVVHLHSFFAGLAGRTAKITKPTVFHPHGWVHQMDGRASLVVGASIERSLAPRTGAIVTVNAEERQLGHDANIDARFHEVGVPVDLERFASLPNKDSARRQLGVQGPLAVCVGRLCAQKGQRELIDLWEQHTDGSVTLALVGPAQDGFDLPDRLPKSILHTGRTDPGPWLAAADVVVQPSHWEGQSIAVGEALASGRPVVAFDVTGMRRAILDGAFEAAGAVVPKGAYELLINEALLRIQRPLLRAQEGHAGRQRANHLFSPTTMADRLDHLYQELIG